MIPIFNGVVKNGRLILSDEDKFKSFLTTLTGDIELTIRRPNRGRSNQQNRFLWGVIYHLISEETGYTPNEVHDAMRMLFLRDNDREIPTLLSTTSLSVVEMSRYQEQIRQFAAQNLNLSIPEPNEVEL